MAERDDLRGWAGRSAGIGVMLALVLAVGCKLPPPNLKPPEGPQELNKPPMAARYDNPEWPKEALVENNPKRNPFGTDSLKDGMPVSAPGGMNNMGGMGMQR